MDEKLFRIKGYEDYLISKSGRVYSTIQKKFLKLGFRQGYYYVSLKDRRLGKYIKINIHRLVATQFISNYRNLPVVNHKDGNKRNNSVYNLEWCTAEYNQRHAIKMGLFKVEEEDNPRAKLTKAQVIEIYQYYYDKKYNKRQISKLFNVSDSLIGEIVKGKRWSDVYLNYFGKPSEYKKCKRKHLNKDTYRAILIDHFKNGLNTVQIASKYNITNAYAGKIINFKNVSIKLINTLKEIYKTLDNQQPSSCN